MVHASHTASELVPHAPRYCPTPHVVMLHSSQMDPFRNMKSLQFIAGVFSVQGGVVIGVDVDVFATGVVPPNGVD